MSTKDLIRSHIQPVFESAPFLRHIGVRFLDCDIGWCEAELDLQPFHNQHMGVGHAGVTATLADHCAGSAAATTLTRPGIGVVTVEFKINLLRPAIGDRLFCRAEVLKPGSRFCVVESSVYALTGEARKLVAKMNATIAFVDSAASR